MTTCPLAGPCHGAHDCSLSSALYAIPKSPQLALTEMTRADVRAEGVRWGYWEYGAQRDAVPVKVMGHTNYVFPYQRAGVHLTLFHILVGEGVSRWTLESAIMDATETQDEIWVQEHNVHGHSWRHPARWPTGHKTNPPREADSQLYSLEELTHKVSRIAITQCPDFQLLQSCLIKTPQDPAGRNMQVGVRCRCNGCDSLFCRPWHTDTLYQGPPFVYTAPADPPFDPAARTLANQGFGAYATVIGGLTGLDALATPHFSADAVYFFDLNPWMVDFAKLVVQLVLQSPTRLTFLSHMLRRDLLSTGLFPLPMKDPHHAARRVAEAAARTAPVYQAPLNLTQGERCTYDWLLSNASRVCEERDVFRDPRRPPSINPHGILRPRTTRHKNTCAFYYGHGWLSSEATFQRVQQHLRVSQLHFKPYSLHAPLHTLVGTVPQRLLLYTSNVVRPDRMGPLHARLKDDDLVHSVAHLYRGTTPEQLYLIREF